MRNKKDVPCIFYPNKKCINCYYCEEDDYLDTIDEPSEDEIIEQLIYESERKADLM